MIEQPAGTGYDDIDAGTQFLDLGVHAHAPVNRTACEARVPSQFPDRYMDLFRQFACGCNDQGAHFAAQAWEQTLQNRQHKCSCFTGSGLGKAHNVFT
ncbi:MAG: hypothetical protein A4E63_02967 [Syntrophorhabdus sp. PtaU1.Bin050]|nr:MAG: hypothetical protein A4E63_02967 [Syntrophorhabdus sp. PtaU1.Bin050]